MDEGNKKADHQHKQMHSLLSDFSGKIMETMQQNQETQNQNHKLLSTRIDDIQATSDSLDQRMTKIEQGGSVSGDHSHRTLLLNSIQKSKFKLKIMGLKGKATEARVR